jgi:hypothetical protein
MKTRSLHIDTSTGQIIVNGTGTGCHLGICARTTVIVLEFVARSLRRLCLHIIAASVGLQGRVDELAREITGRAL